MSYNYINTARVPEVKDTVNFADRFWYVLELKKNNLRTIMQKSNTHLCNID